MPRSTNSGSTTTTSRIGTSWPHLLLRLYLHLPLYLRLRLHLRLYLLVHLRLHLYRRTRPVIIQIRLIDPVSPRRPSSNPNASHGPSASYDAGSSTSSSRARSTSPQRASRRAGQGSTGYLDRLLRNLRFPAGMIVGQNNK